MKHIFQKELPLQNNCPAEPQLHRSSVYSTDVHGYNTLTAVILSAQEEVTMRPKDREMTQHGGPPGWMKESDMTKPGEICSELLANSGCCCWCSSTECTQIPSVGLSWKDQTLVRSLKWLDIRTVSAEMFNCKLLHATRAAGRKHFYFTYMWWNYQWPAMTEL
jgi:hypothetical protein